MRRIAIVALLLASTASAQYTWRSTLDAIRTVETGGCPNGGIGAKGDRGNALGPFQIWKIYHTDAAERDKSLTDYRRCLTSRSYSERVVKAYMLRYCGAAVRRLAKGTGTLADVERVARVHNGGPRGHKKKATLAYWAKVKQEVSR